GEREAAVVAVRPPVQRHAQRPNEGQLHPDAERGEPLLEAPARDDLLNFLKPNLRPRSSGGQPVVLALDLAELDTPIDSAHVRLIEVGWSRHRAATRQRHGALTRSR